MTSKPRCHITSLKTDVKIVPTIVASKAIQGNFSLRHKIEEIHYKIKKTSNLNTAGPLAPGPPRAPAAPGNP